MTVERAASAKDPKFALIEYLADGKFHSGEDLARRTNVTRAAVWKQLRRMSEQTGLEVQAVRGRGYRLISPLELLDESALRNRLSQHTRSRLQDFCIVPSLESTNDFVSARPRPPVGMGVLCAAEFQTAGRGRRGRHWISSFGANLTFSLGWQFDMPLSGLSGLSLAVGVALAEALQSFGLQQHQLKWPNDLHWQGSKLAGILVEAVGETEGPAFAVIGIGLNLRMSEIENAEIDQPWVDLSSAGLSDLSRNDLAVGLIDHLITTCDGYALHGLKPFLSSWRNYDGYVGRQVKLLRGSQCEVGRYVGIREDGALLLDCAGESRAFFAGEVSLRKTEDVASQ